MSAWIRMIPLEEATGKLAEAYAQVRTPHGTVDNVMKAHSLRLVSTDRWRHRRHAEEAWLASLKSLGKQINANDYEDLALAA